MTTRVAVPAKEIVAGDCINTEHTANWGVMSVRHDPEDGRVYLMMSPTGATVLSLGPDDLVGKSVFTTDPEAVRRSVRKSFPRVDMWDTFDDAVAGSRGDAIYAWWLDQIVRVRREADLDTLPGYVQVFWATRTTVADLIGKR